MKINNVRPDKHKYLKVLADIAQPVGLLYFIGNLPEDRKPTAAVIGTRKLTSYGRETGYKIAYELAAQGVVVVSGLALGADALAHRAALEAGGTTIAVLPGGLDQIYPASHRQLAIDILNHGGALVSEFEPGSPVYPSNFIRRNRIVSGLSDALIVIEAAAKSGTMHTANFALEQGRTVMAVPGNITSPMSAGCNNLIKTGAFPVTDTRDILHELGLHRPRQAKLPLADSPEESIVLNLISQGISDAGLIQQQSRLPPQNFAQTLSLLEINGKIRPLGGNRWGLF